MNITRISSGFILAWQVMATYPTVGGGEIQLLYMNCPDDKARIVVAELEPDGRVKDYGCSTPSEGYQVIDWIGGGRSMLKNSKFTWDKPQP